MRGEKHVLRVAAIVSLAFMAVLAVIAPNVDFGSGAAPGLSATVGAEATEEATVRISAKRLANGRTEMRLQVWTDGAWDAKRLPPARRHLTANARVNTWIRSGTIELTSGHVVRISARRLESGQIEFRLLEVVDGEDSKPMLPEERLLPRSAAVGVWHNTSPLVLADPDPPPGYTPVVDASGWVGTKVEFSSSYDDEGVHTWVRSRARYENDAEGRAEAFVVAGGRQYLTQACRNSDELSLQIDGLPVQDGALLVMSSESDDPEVSDARVVEVDLSIDDGDVETQFWSSGVTIDPAAQYVSAGDQTSELLARLREASSVTLEVVGSVLPAATFDLNGMFDTRVQGNIDECGNYADPTWTPIREAQSGRTDAGVRYEIDYPDRLNGERETSLRTQSDEASMASDQRIGFWTHCRQGRYTFQLDGFPSASVGEQAVRSRLDDGEWTDATWDILVTDGGFVYTFPPFDYAWLRGGETLEIEIPLDPVLSASFDLAALFSTPVQANMDNCGVPVWPEPEPTYVPLVNVDGRLSASIRYRVDQRNDRIFSTVTSISDTAGHDDEPVRFDYGCSRGEHTVLSFAPFSPLEPGRQYDATFSLDDNAPEAATWTSEPRGLNFSTGEILDSALVARDSSLTVERLRSASSLTVEIPATGLGPITFDVTGMFDTPIQENIDECGNYKPGETRELPPDLNTSGQVSTSDGDVVSYGRNQGPGTIPSTRLLLYVFEERATVLTLSFACSDQGATLVMWGDSADELSGEEVDVSWSLDDASESRETWKVRNARFVNPVDAAAIVQTWRNGQELALTVHSATPVSVRIDLATLFSTPVQPSLDECLALPVQNPSVPAGEVDYTTEGDLWYRSSKAAGSHVAYTEILLSHGESFQDTVRLTVSCGLDGVRVAIGNIGRGQYLAVSGATVEVTWSVGNGAPQIAIWDVWPQGGGHSVSPQDDSAFYAAIKDADSLSYSVASDPVATGDFDLDENGFWWTPVQPNLDACPGS